MTIYIWICVSILAVLFYFDYWTTRNALKSQNNSEANQGMAWMFKQFGIEHVLILTKLASFGVIVWLAHGGAFNSRIGVIELTALTALYAVVVNSNYRIYLKTK